MAALWLILNVKIGDTVFPLCSIDEATLLSVILCRFRKIFGKTPPKLYRSLRDQSYHTLAQLSAKFNYSVFTILHTRIYSMIKALT